LGIASYAKIELVTIHLGHHDVGNDEIGDVGFHPVQCLDAISHNLGLKAVALKRPPEAIGDSWIILDD
jgi:hypothetical protein